jgi:hypothetical protein
VLRCLRGRNVIHTRLHSGSIYSLGHGARTTADGVCQALNATTHRAHWRALDRSSKLPPDGTPVAAPLSPPQTPSDGRTCLAQPHTHHRACTTSGGRMHQCSTPNKLSAAPVCAPTRFGRLGNLRQLYSSALAHDLLGTVSSHPALVPSYACTPVGRLLPQNNTTPRSRRRNTPQTNLSTADARNPPAP